MIALSFLSSVTIFCSFFLLDPELFLYARFLSGLVHGMKYFVFGFLVCVEFQNEPANCHSISLLNKMVFGIGYTLAFLLSALISKSERTIHFILGFSMIPSLCICVICLVSPVRDELNHKKDLLLGALNATCNDDLDEDVDHPRMPKYPKLKRIRKRDSYKGYVNRLFAMFNGGLGCLCELSKGTEVLFCFLPVLLLIAGLSHDEVLWMCTLQGFLFAMNTLVSCYLLSSQDTPIKRSATLAAGSILSLVCISAGFGFIHDSYPSIVSADDATCGVFEYSTDCVRSSKCGYCGNEYKGRCIESASTVPFKDTCSDSWYLNYPPNSFWWVVFLTLLLNFFFRGPNYDGSMFFMNGGLGVFPTTRLNLMFQNTIYWSFLSSLSLVSIPAYNNLGITVAFALFAALSAILHSCLTLVS